VSISLSSCSACLEYSSFAIATTSIAPCAGNHPVDQYNLLVWVDSFRQSCCKYSSTQSLKFFHAWVYISTQINYGMIGIFKPLRLTAANCLWQWYLYYLKNLDFLYELKGQCWLFQNCSLNNSLWCAVGVFIGIIPQYPHHNHSNIGVFGKIPVIPNS
jgi:hypothetical protein